MTARIIPARSRPPAIDEPAPSHPKILALARALGLALARQDHLSQTRTAIGGSPAHAETETPSAAD